MRWASEITLSASLFSALSAAWPDAAEALDVEVFFAAVLVRLLPAAGLRAAGFLSALAVPAFAARVDFDFGLDLPAAPLRAAGFFSAFAVADLTAGLSSNWAMLLLQISSSSASSRVRFSVSFSASMICC